MKPEVSLCTDEKIVKDTIFQFTTMIKEKYRDIIHNIILYGSWARGEVKPDSDVDLLIITDEISYKIQYDIIVLAGSFFPDTDVYLYVKLMNEKEYKTAKKFSFLKNVSSEGIAIV